MQCGKKRMFVVGLTGVDLLGPVLTQACAGFAYYIRTDRQTETTEIIYTTPLRW